MADPCQLQQLPQMTDGPAEMGRVSPTRRVKLALKRRLTPVQKRAIKMRISQAISLVHRIVGRSKEPEIAAAPREALTLQAGDRVRVRDWDEIRATLSRWNDLRGCVFMDGMRPYCGTEQRVLKPVTQFLDERDYQMKKCRGLVLLEGMMCEGMAEYGPCDRSCFFFWRTDWLEKL